jgi:glycosyltransferase involved in cell wall biosynthesis
MKKVCFISQCSLPIPSTKGGAVETLVDYLVEENEKQELFDFTIISIFDRLAFNKSIKYKRSKIIFVKKRNSFLNKVYFCFYRLLNRFKIYIPFSLEAYEILNKIKNMDKDQIFVYEAGPTSFIKLLSKYIDKGSLIVHLHWDGLGNKKLDNYFGYLLAVSDYISKNWSLKTGRDPKKSIVFKNCVNESIFKKRLSFEQVNLLKGKLNIPMKNKIILYIGRIVKEKGVVELLDSFNKIDCNDVTLLIVGSSCFGNKTNTKYEKIVNKKIQASKKQIIFTGFINQEDLYKYYSISDVSVIPSKFEDPAPLVFVEAQISGKPIIATKVGGLPEYSFGNNIFFIDKKDLTNNLTDKLNFVLKNVKFEKNSTTTCDLPDGFNVESYYSNFTNIINGIIENKKCHSNL